MPPFRTKHALVYVRLAGHSRRVSALRLDGAKAGMVRVFLRGRTYAVQQHLLAVPAEAWRPVHYTSG